jgi:hypothetical protein
MEERFGCAIEVFKSMGDATGGRGLGDIAKLLVLVPNEPPTHARASLLDQLFTIAEASPTQRASILHGIAFQMHKDLTDRPETGLEQLTRLLKINADVPPEHRHEALCMPARTLMLHANRIQTDLLWTKVVNMIVGGAQQLPKEGRRKVMDALHEGIDDIEQFPSRSGSDRHLATNSEIADARQIVNTLSEPT